MGDETITGGDERLDQLALDGRMSLEYFQGYFTPEIINRIHIRRFDGPVQRRNVVLAHPVGDQFGTMQWTMVGRFPLFIVFLWSLWAVNVDLTLVRRSSIPL